MMLRVRLTDTSDEDSGVPSSLSYKERKKGMPEILGENKKGKCAGSNLGSLCSAATRAQTHCSSNFCVNSKAALCDKLRHFLENR